MPVNVNRTALDALLAQAEALGNRTDWKVKTTGAEVSFNRKSGDDDLPVLTIEVPSYTDPAPRDIASALARDLGRAATLTDVAAIVRQALAAEKDYFAATGVKATGNNEIYGIQALRRDAFFAGVSSALTRQSALSAKDTAALGGLLAELRESMLTGRDYRMELGSHENYWPYWNNYLAVLEKMLKQLSPTHPAYAALKARIEEVYNRKTARGQSIDESDAESSMRMAVVYRPIGSKEKGHRVSLAATSAPDAPAYEVLSVATRGLPQGLESYAGKAVVRDADGKLSFDFAGGDVPAALAAHLERRAVSAADCGLRPLLPSERARKDIPYDWDRNGAIHPGLIDISWWGHCHNEAPLNALGINPKYSVTWYKAGEKDAEALQLFSASDIWDLSGNLMAERENGFGKRSGGQYQDLDATTFVGDRNNGSHEMALTVPGRGELRVDFEVQTWIENGRPMNLSAFRTHLEAADGKTFAANPNVTAHDGDTVALEGTGRHITGQVKYIDLDDHGYRNEVKQYVELDPSKDAFVKLSATVLSRPGQGRAGEVEEYYYNPKTKQVQTKRVQVTLDAQGRAQRTDGPTSTPKRVDGMAVRQETPFDSVKEIHQFCSDKIGQPFVFDTSPDMAVWNYPVNFLRIDQVSKSEQPDGFYTRYKLRYETMGGPSGEVEYIIKRNAQGEMIDACALSPMPDFAFRHERVEMAAVSVGRDGRLVYNLGAAEGGYLFNGNDPTPGRELYERQLKVLYAGLSSSQDSYVFEDDDQKLYRFTDKASFDAAIKAREAQA